MGVNFFGVVVGVAVVSTLVGIVLWPSNDAVMTIVLRDPPNPGVERNTLIITKNFMSCEKRGKRCFTEALQQRHFTHFLFLSEAQHVASTVKYPLSKLDQNTNYYVLVRRGDAWVYRAPILLSRIGLEMCVFRGHSLKCPSHMNFAPIDDIIVYEPTYSGPILETEDSQPHPAHLGKMYEELNNTSAALAQYELEKEYLFYATYRMAVLKMDNSLFLKAYDLNPLRREPLYYLARMARSQNNITRCLLYCQAGISIAYGDLDGDELYIEHNIYEWALDEQYAECLYFAGKKELAKRYWDHLLQNKPTLPPDARMRIFSNANLRK